MNTANILYPRTSRLKVHATKAWTILCLLDIRSLGGNPKDNKSQNGLRPFYIQNIMKKLISILLFACMAIGMSAQEAQEHLKFKGIPIDGTVSEFVAKLKQKGCTYIESYDSGVMMKGDFATEKNCTILVAAPKANCPLERILVICPDKDTWSSLYNNYARLKDMLAAKYGEPFSCEEKFQGYSEPDTDSEKMYEVKMDRCKYISVFENENGYIELNISHNGRYSCYVRLLYVDSVNKNAAESKAMDDI